MSDFDKKLGQIIFDNICSYATDTPMEAVACDLARRIINSIDKNNITVEKNPLKNSPYLRKNIFNFGKVYHILIFYSSCFLFFMLFVS